MVVWRRVTSGVTSCVTKLAQPTRTMSSIDNINFENLALKALPVDKSKTAGSRRVEGACFSLADPTPVDSPQLVALSQPALGLLDIAPADTHDPRLVDILAGNALFPSSVTAAHCYCGHQFGHFSGQLGDGTVLYLGDKRNSSGQRYEMQLKGAGKTPFSRNSDGRKVLRSSIREFLASEAMHHLGVPTTRAGSCVTSESRVVRDIEYSGNNILERCTIVSRIAPTFLRFGSFEIFKSEDGETGRDGPSSGEVHRPLLGRMLHYTCQNFFPEIWASQGDRVGRVCEMYAEIVRLTAFLVAQWQCVGFCHGVLNTDNMSILGLTIDYGPYGFLDRYDPDHICNGSDDGGRYSYKKQPEICKWNLRKLLEMFALEVPEERLYSSLVKYDDYFAEYYHRKMRAKLGLLTEEEGDKELLSSLLETMRKTGCDFTNTFRCLSRLQPRSGGHLHNPSLAEVKRLLLSYCSTAEELRLQFKPRISQRELQMVNQLAETNPMILQFMGGGKLLKELRKMEIYEQYADVTDEGKRAEDASEWDTWLSRYVDRLDTDYPPGVAQPLLHRRREIMDSNNPKFILRNHVMQSAIEKAEDGNFTEVRRLLLLSENPYSESVDLGSLHADTLSGAQDQPDAPQVAADKYFCKPPMSALQMVVT